MTAMAKRIILTDIEGTTSSISFVKDVLFPYARRELPDFVRAHGNQPEVRRWLDAVAMELGGMCDDAMLVDGIFDIRRARPLARLGYLDYAEIREIFSARRPPYRG